MRNTLIFIGLNIGFYLLFLMVADFQQPIINEYITPLIASIPLACIIYCFTIGIIDVLINKENVEVEDFNKKKKKKSHLKIIK